MTHLFPWFDEFFFAIVPGILSVGFHPYKNKKSALPFSWTARFLFSGPSLQAFNVSGMIGLWFRRSGQAQLVEPGHPLCRDRLYHQNL